MKTIEVSKLFHNLGGIPGIVVTLYLCLVATVDLYLGINGQPGRMNLLVPVIMVIVIAVPLTTLLLRKIPSVRAWPRILGDKKWKLAIWFSIAFAVSFAVLSLWHQAYYPISTPSDVLHEIKEIVTGEYDDWHPLLHVLLFYWIPLNLTGDVASIVTAQIIVFSLVAAYMAITMMEYGGIIWYLLSLTFIFANPTTGHLAVSPWKDFSFALGMLTLVTMMVRIYASRGAWLNNPVRLFAFSIMLVLTSILRHNGILFTIPLLVLVLVFYGSKKTKMGIVAVFLIVFFLIKVVLYAPFDLPPNKNRTVETMGLPLTVISHVTKYNPQALDEDSREFLYSYASPESWAQYIDGNFNFVKWQGDANQQVIEDKGRAYIFDLMMECFKVDRSNATKGLLSLTRYVYSPEMSTLWHTPKVAEEKPDSVGNFRYEPQKASLERLNQMESYTQMVKDTPLKYINSLGLILIIFLILFALRSDLRTREGWRRTFIVIPFACYTGGTMLLLSGNDIRYFFGVIVCAPVMVLLAFLEPNVETASAPLQAQHAKMIEESDETGNITDEYPEQ